MPTPTRREWRGVFAIVIACLLASPLGWMPVVIAAIVTAKLQPWFDTSMFVGKVWKHSIRGIIK